MPNRVLYISTDGMTEALGQSQVLAYLRVLATYGYQFHLISFEKPEYYEQERAHVLGLLEGTGIHWHPLPYHNRPPILGTLRDQRAGWQLVRSLWAQHPFQLVHCRSYLPALLGLRAQKKWGARFIFDMRGWWPDQRLESGAWRSPLFRPVYRYFKQKERLFFSKSDLTVSLTYAGRDEIVRLGYRLPEDILVVPTCVDFRSFPPPTLADRLAIRAQYGISAEQYVVINSGSLGGNYPVREVFDIFQGIRLQRPDAHLLLLTKTPAEEAQAAYRAYGLPDQAVTVASVRYHQVHRYLAAADVGLFVYRPLYSSLGSSPTKLGEYWAMGLPVLSTSGVGDVDQILATHPGSGVSMPLGLSPAEIAPYAARLEAERAGAATLRQYAVQYYSLEAGCQKYSEEYARMLALPPRRT